MWQVSGVHRPHWGLAKLYSIFGLHERLSNLNVIRAYGYKGQTELVYSKCLVHPGTFHGVHGTHMHATKHFRPLNTSYRHYSRRSGLVVDYWMWGISVVFSSDQFVFYGYVSVIIEFVLNECSHIFQCLKGSKGPSTCWGEWPQGGFGRWSHSVHRLRAGTSTSAGLFACSYARTIACGNSWPNRSQEIGKLN